MKKSLILLFGLILISLMATPLVQAKTVKFLGEDVAIMPLQDVKPGMVGYGLSVFDESQRIEQFQVEIKTITFFIKNKYIIWAKAWGGPNNILDRAGVIAGMSGSPIYLKDPQDNQWKLIGALAYGYNFQQPSEALAGITPIEEMLELEKLANAYYGKGSQNESQGIINFFPNQEMIRIPLRLTGSRNAIKMFESKINERLPAKLYEQQDFRFKSATQYVLSPKNTLQAGDAIAAVLSMGDLPFAAVGTVTLANSRGFLAFGHPFLWTGMSNIPVFKAEIGMIVPNIEASFKERKDLTEPQLGTIVIDSLEGIMGIWHERTTLAPLSINFTIYHINGLARNEQWTIKIARNNPYSSLLLPLGILYAIEIGSPSLFNLSYNIETDFIYEDRGAEQKLSVSKKFFSKQGKEIVSNIMGLGDIYTMFEKAKINLTGIKVNIAVTQEKAEIPTLYLSSVETEKTVIKSDEDLLIGLMISDKEKNYSKPLKLKAPAFQGEMRIKIQDSDSRLKDLVSEALREPSKIKRVFDFIQASVNRNNIFYAEVQHIKSITERQGKDNKGWQETDKKTEELTNVEVVEIELPEITGKFYVNISAQKTIYVKNGNSRDVPERTIQNTVKQIKHDNTIKFKPGLFINLPFNGAYSDIKGNLRTDLFGTDIGLIEYKRLQILNFGFGININTNLDNTELYGKFAPVKIKVWKDLFAEANIAINDKGKFLMGVTLSLKIF